MIQGGGKKFVGLESPVIGPILHGENDRWEEAVKPMEARPRGKKNRGLKSESRRNRHEGGVWALLYIRGKKDTGQ